MCIRDSDNAIRNNVDKLDKYAEYLKDLKNALTKEHKRYGEVGLLKDGKRIQIN